MAQARDEAGNIWEVDAQGNPVRLIQAAAGASQGRVFTLPGDPTKDAQGQATLTRTQQEIKQAEATAGSTATKAAADAAKSELDLKNAQEAYAAAHPKGTGSTVMGPAFLDTLSVPDREIVRALGEGRIAFPAGFALKAPWWQQKLEQVAQAYPNFDATNFNNRAKARATIVNGKLGGSSNALNTAIGHLDLLSSQLGGTASHGPWEIGGVPIPGATMVNALENKVMRSSGESGITNAQDTASKLADELESLYRNGGGTEQGVVRQLRNLDLNGSMEQKQGIIRNALELAASKQAANLYQYNLGSGGKPEVDLLDPNARAVLDKYPDIRDKYFAPPAPPLSDHAAALLKANGGLPPPPGDGETPPGPGPGPDPTLSPTNGQQQSRYDPRMSSQIDAMMNAGAGLGTINATLKRQNLAPISAASFNAAKQWMAKNPGQKYFGADISRNEDLNLGQRVLAAPVIAPLATAAVRGGDAASAGLLGAVSGEEGRGAMEAMGALHPDAAILGDTAGGLTGALGGEALAGRALANIPRALKYAPAIGDMLYGGLLGFNRAEPGQGGAGAVEGAAGGLAGNLLMKGAGSVLRGVADPAVQFLRSKGVPLTVGQVLANSGRLGATAKSLEDAMTSIPGVGNVIKARQREGLEGFNSAAFGDLPGHSGATGSAGIREGGQLVDNAYNFLDHTNLPIDAPYAGTEATIRAAAPSRFAPDINDQLDMTASRAVDGSLAGRDWQSALRANRANRASVAGEPYADPAVAAHNDIEDNLMGLAQRQGPPDTVPNLDAANLLYSRYQTLAKALDNGPAQQADELFTPARLDAAARQGANQFQGRAQSVMGNRPFYDLTTAGRSVLPSTIPDSGTATRGLVAMGLTGAGSGAGVGALTGDTQTGAETGLGLTLLLAAGGSKPAQRAMVKVLADRPDIARKAGNLIYDKGWVGSGILAPLLTGP